MASFPDLRLLDLSSDSTEGCRLFRNTKPAAAAALLLAAVGTTASAYLELATLQGRRAVHSTLDLLTRAPGALHPASLVRISAAARGTA